MRFIAGDTTLSAVGRKQFRGPNCAMNLDDSGTGAAPKIPYRRKYRLLRSELIGGGRDINASGVEIDTRDREKIPDHPRNSLSIRRKLYLYFFFGNRNIPRHARISKNHSFCYATFF